MPCLQVEIEFVIVPLYIYCTSVILRYVWRHKYGDSAKYVVTICGIRKCQRNINRLIGYLARDGCIKIPERLSDADRTYGCLLVDYGLCNRNE